MKLIMNITQIFRRIAQRLTPRHFGLLTGIFCIIGLFSALQLSSSFLLNASLNDAQRNEQQNLLAWQQQSKLDLARVSLLAASDLLNRSGVWFMQDKETGSDGSWHSLMDDAQKALETGIAWKVVPDDTLLDEARRLALAIADRPAGAVADVKRAINDGFHSSLEDAMAQETVATVRGFLSPEAQAKAKGF